MPAFDKTGPQGTGPIGKGKGGCDTDTSTPAYGFGRGRGMRRGNGFGRGCGMRRGRCCDNQPTTADEKTYLENDIKAMQKRLDELNKQGS